MLEEVTVVKQRIHKNTILNPRALVDIILPEHLLYNYYPCIYSQLGFLRVWIYVLI